MFKFTEPDLTGPIKQPSNTLTGLSYLIISFLILPQNLLISLSTFFICATTIYYHAKNTNFSEKLDLFSIFVLASILLYKGFPFNNLNLANFMIGTLLFCIAWVFWIIDIKKIIIPKNHILTGHGIWHILTAISILFFYSSLPIH